METPLREQKYKHMREILNEKQWRQYLANLGLDRETAEFAVESIRRWWQQIGKNLYPDKQELLITSDGGGSNGS